MWHTHHYVYILNVPINVQKATACAPSTQQYAVSVQCGPSSVIGRASGDEESTTNKPLALKIISDNYILCHHHHPATAVDQYTCVCAPSIELYALTISCGPSSVIGRASGSEESMTNKPLVLEITSHKVLAYIMSPSPPSHCC